MPTSTSIAPQTQAGSTSRKALSSGAQSGSLFHSNSEKYSDTGTEPTTGRSGSAVIQSRALIAKDGSTLVESTTGVLDGQPGAGAFKHVQAKLQDAAGSTQRALNYTSLAGGYWSQTYTGIARNDTVQLMSDITGVDAPRTDVVTTVDTAKLRPDLAVLRITSPTKAYVHAPVAFTAYVSELNGDVGAHADCVLFVDGQQVAQALGIWVDAGHTVACSFQTTFATTGTKHIVVSATNVVPADWDLSNNSAQTTIAIVDPIVKLGYYVSASNIADNFTFSQTYSGNYFPSYTEHYVQNSSDAYIVGYTFSHQFQFPVQISANVTADGTSIGQFASTTFAPTYNNGYYVCSQNYVPGGYAAACSANDGTFSEAVYQTYRTDVTYYDLYANNYCGYYGCSGTYNYTYGTAAGQFDIGSSDQFTMNVIDTTGTTYQVATPALATTSFSQPQNYNYCYSYYENYNYCYSETGVYSGKYVNSSAPDGGS